MSTPLAASAPRSRSFLPVFLRPHLIWRFMKDARASRWSKLFFAAAILYAVFPIDLVPDAIPVVGWLDDIGLLTAAMGWAMSRVARYDREHPEGVVIDVTPTK